MEKTWIEEMKKAMEAMTTACFHNPNWADCRLCPFSEYCYTLEEGGYDIPPKCQNKKSS